MGISGVRTMSPHIWPPSREGASWLRIPHLDEGIERFLGQLAHRQGALLLKFLGQHR
jgi:hypothetical protein